MKMRKRPANIVWSAQAIVDLTEVSTYLRQFSSSIARRICDEIADSTERLTQFPLSGHILPEFPEGRYREVVTRDYRIIYKERQGTVTILTIVHGRRDLPSTPFFRQQESKPLEETDS